MHVEVKTNGYRLSNLDQDKLDQAVAHLDRLTDTYSNRRLHVSIERFGHSEECQVRMLLSVAKHRLVALDRAPSVAPAAQRCVDILSGKIAHAKDRVHRNHGERTIRRAKEESGVEDLIEAEVARRIKFHPEAEALLGDGFSFEDVVDAVVFHAYENHSGRPANVPFREWMVSNVDECIDQVAAASREDLAA